MARARPVPPSCPAAGSASAQQILEWAILNYRLACCTVLAALPAAVLVGCIGPTVPFGYKKAQDFPVAIEGSLLEQMTNEHWNRGDVIGTLGTPDSENRERRTIGFERCVESVAKEGFVLVLPLPIWGPAGDVSHCQLVKLCFDDDDHLTGWAERLGMMPDQDSDDRQYYHLQCQLEEWLSGRPCQDGRTFTGKGADC